MAYVNEADVSAALIGVLDLMRQEDDFEQRAINLQRLHSDLDSETVREVRRIAYGLRVQGWETHRVARLLGISTRTVRRYVAEHMDLTGDPRPPMRPPAPEPIHFVIHAPIRT